MRHTPVSLLCMLMLGSCASPPKPPGVDESRRRPANASAAVELQSCRSELQNTRIAANESQRTAAAAAAIASAAQLAQAASASNGRNAVYAVLFPYGSTRVQVADADIVRLVEDARGAPLIVLRGRTDGVAVSMAEGRVARQRAVAVQDLLVQAGVEPSRIRTTWQPAGDHAADNELPGGRALNRRVEVEIYRTAPQPPVALVSGASPNGDRRASRSFMSEVSYGQQQH